MCPWVEQMPENTLRIANTMLEALAHHDRRQSEAWDCQEYLWQQNNTSSPIADFPSLPQANQEDTTSSDDAQGTTMAVSVPKTKITVEEYQHCRLSKQCIQLQSSTKMKMARHWPMRILPHKMTQPTFRLAMRHQHLQCQAHGVPGIYNS